jgi:dTDP-4-amino-4,6-dideoxygalactose transaminase
MSSVATAIPFHRAFCAPEAEAYVAEAVRSGAWAGNGQWGRRCREALQGLLGSEVFLTPSCTSALEMAAVLLDIQPGDEVIVPAYTFVSTASAFALRGARIVFADVEPSTINLDPAAVAARLAPRTRAVVPVHYAGIACDMDALLSLCEARGIAVVEDNAHGLFGTHMGRPLGTLGALGTLSFHETKNLSCGEGGALVLNRPEWRERAEIAQEKGTDRSRFLLGLTDKYTWVAPGSSYLLGELPAALLYANLQASEPVQRHRVALWNRYQSELRAWCEANDVQQPYVPAYSEHPAHLYHLLLPDLKRRQSLMFHLRDRGVQAAYHYQALHLSPMAVKHGAAPGDCPVAERVAQQILRLPLHAGMTYEQQDRVLETLFQWRRP